MNKIKLTPTLLLVMLVFSSPPIQAMPFLDNCLNLVGKIIAAVDKPKAVAPHPSFEKTLSELTAKGVAGNGYFHLPTLEQTVEEFKKTKVPYIKYHYNAEAHKAPEMTEFLNNTIEVVYTPHASIFGHVRLRIKNKLFGYENVMTTKAGANFNSEFLYHEVRRVKTIKGRGEGKKEGNMGVIFNLTAEDKKILEEREAELFNFYSSSMAFNIPPFDGAGAKEIKLIVDPDSGEMSYKSPTSKSNFGNHARVKGKIVTKEGKEFLVSPSGFEHPISLNAKGERVVESYTCASSIEYVMTKILGKKFAQMPYAGSLMTYLKNGAEDNLSPDAVIHYYPSSDL